MARMVVEKLQLVTCSSYSRPLPMNLKPVQALICATYGASLTEELDTHYRIEFHWRDKEDALYPGKGGGIKS